MREARTKVHLTESLSGEVSGSVIAHRDETVTSEGDRVAFHGQALERVTHTLQGNSIHLQDEVVGEVLHSSYDWDKGVIFDGQIEPELSRSIRIGRLELEATIRYSDDLTERCDGMDWVRFSDDIIGFGDLYINEGT